MFANQSSTHKDKEMNKDMKRYRAFFERFEVTFDMYPSEIHEIGVTDMAHMLLKHEGADVLYSEVQWEEVS